ncbi:MAG: hypothetical protein ACYCRD_11255 [Leptospirillum sp.]
MRDKSGGSKRGGIRPYEAGRDRMAAIRERMERAERRYWDKEGNPLHFWALLSKLDG